MKSDAFLPYRTPASPDPQATFRILEGEVYDVGPKGMRFTIKDWDDGKYIFGPAPWSGHTTMTALGVVAGFDLAHVHTPVVPTKGARALVLFLGDGIDRPWVLGWWPA